MFLLVNLLYFVFLGKYYRYPFYFINPYSNFSQVSDLLLLIFVRTFCVSISTGLSLCRTPEPILQSYHKPTVKRVSIKYLNYFKVILSLGKRKTSIGLIMISSIPLYLYHPFMTFPYLYRTATPPLHFIVSGRYECNFV